MEVPGAQELYGRRWQALCRLLLHVRWSPAFSGHHCVPQERQAHSSAPTTALGKKVSAGGCEHLGEQLQTSDVLSDTRQKEDDKVL